MSNNKVDRIALVEFISGYLITETEGCSKEEMKLILAELDEKVMESFPISEDLTQVKQQPADSGEPCGEYYALGGGKGNDLPFDVVAFRNYPKGVEDKKVTCPTRPGQISDLCPAGCSGKVDCIESMTR